MQFGLQKLEGSIYPVNLGVSHSGGGGSNFGALLANAPFSEIVLFENLRAASARSADRSTAARAAVGGPGLVALCTSHELAGRAHPEFAGALAQFIRAI